MNGLFLLGWRNQFSNEIDRFTLRLWQTFKKQFSHGEKTIEANAEANAIKLEGRDSGNTYDIEIHKDETQRNHLVNKSQASVALSFFADFSLAIFMK